MKSNAVRRWGRDPGIINVKRAVALNKYPIVVAILFAFVAIVAANLGNTFLKGVPDGGIIAQDFALFSSAMTALSLEYGEYKLFPGLYNVYVRARTLPCF